MKPIKVAHVDDHKLFLDGIKLMLSREDDIELTDSVDSAEELLQCFEKRFPDVLLLDLDMPGMNGIDLFKVIRERYGDLKVLVLTAHQEERMIAYLMELGVNGYLFKDITREELKKAIVTVYEEGMYLNDRTAQAVLGGLRRKVSVPPEYGREEFLTQRERDVLESLAQGLSASEIGEKLYISPRTVNGHRNRLREKFKAKNLVDLIIKAAKEGWVELH